MNTPSPAGVVFVDDVANVAAFYRAVAGMTAIVADERHVVLEAAGFQLTIHALPGSEQGTSGPYPTRPDSYIKLCFPVADIAAARSAAAKLGGEVWPMDHEWEARGFRACDGRDPEGNVFQLRQGRAAPARGVSGA